MFFRQYDLPCLSLYSYLIGDPTSGRAVVVDPQRDISVYLADAESVGLRIERVIETHFHADFVSGHLELAAATGAVISYGDVAHTDFPMEPLAHLQRLSLGEVTLEVRHTPGHTPEAISIVVHETPTGPPVAVLTGDTLFIGDVGRPDLLTSVGHSAESLARSLYRSLHGQLLTLPDATMVYPAHGAGSACGKHLSAAAASTIGEQRATNYALAPMTEDEFVSVVTDGQTEAPLYFAFAADTNRRERELLDDHATPPRLTADELVAARNAGAIVLDTRSPEAFASGHLEGSVNVGLDGRFAEYAGDVLRPGERVVIVADAGRDAEVKVRLARIGFDNVVGAFVGIEEFLEQRRDLAAASSRLNAVELARRIATGEELQIVDVRNPSEVDQAGAIPGAFNLPLPRLLDHLTDIDPAKPTIVYCAGGYRSSIAASTLRSKGFATVADIQGGFGAWQLAATDQRG